MSVNKNLSKLALNVNANGDVTDAGLSTTFTSNGYSQGRFASNNFVKATFTSNNYVDNQLSTLSTQISARATNTYVQSTFTSNNYSQNFFTNAGNITSGTLPSGRLSGTYSISISGSADRLDGKDSTDFTSNTYINSRNLSSNNYIQGRFTSNSFAKSTFTSNNYVDGRFVANNFVIGRYTSNNYVKTTLASNNYVKDSFTSNNYVKATFTSNAYIGTALPQDLPQQTVNTFNYGLITDGTIDSTDDYGLITDGTINDSFDRGSLDLRTIEAAGQIVIDSPNNALIITDGVTRGGLYLMNSDLNNRDLTKMDKNKQGKAILRVITTDATTSHKIPIPYAGNDQQTIWSPVRMNDTVISDPNLGKRSDGGYYSANIGGLYMVEFHTMTDVDVDIGFGVNLSEPTAQNEFKFKANTRGSYKSTINISAGDTIYVMAYANSTVTYRKDETRLFIEYLGQ